MRVLTRLRWVLPALALAATSCGNEQPPATPGRHIPFTVQGEPLPWRGPAGYVIAADSREGLLAAYFGVPSGQGDQACAARFGSERCLPGLVEPPGTLWLLVYVPADCTHSGRVADVTQSDGHVYVSLAVTQAQCPPGTGALAQPMLTLITAGPLSSAPVSLASVEYSASLKADDMSTQVYD